MSNYDERRGKCRYCGDWHHQDAEGYRDCAKSLSEQLATVRKELEFIKSTRMVYGVAPYTLAHAEDHTWAGE